MRVSARGAAVAAATFLPPPPAAADAAAAPPDDGGADGGGGAGGADDDGGADAASAKRARKRARRGRDTRPRGGRPLRHAHPVKTGDDPSGSKFEARAVINRHRTSLGARARGGL